MPSTADVRSYADAALDAALEQGKQALEVAQTSLGKLQHNVKSLDAIGPQVDSLREAIEPYVMSALTYGTTLAGKLETAMSELKSDLMKDKRVAQVIGGTEAFATAVVEAVQDRITKAAGSAAASAALVRQGPSRSSRISRASGPAPTRPATKPATTKPAASTSSTSADAKPAAKSTPAAKANGTKPATKATKATKATTVKATATAPAAKATARKSAPANAKAVRTAAPAEPSANGTSHTHA